MGGDPGCGMMIGYIIGIIILVFVVVQFIMPMVLSILNGVWGFMVVVFIVFIFLGGLSSLNR
jgi:hypothetical protein